MRLLTLVTECLFVSLQLITTFQTIPATIVPLIALFAQWIRIMFIVHLVPSELGLTLLAILATEFLSVTPRPTTTFLITLATIAQ